jgi:hypothetical protein
VAAQRRPCHFFEDSKGRLEKYWYCTVHRTRVSDPLEPCFPSRYDGTPFEPCPGWSYDGCPRYIHCHFWDKKHRVEGVGGGFIARKGSNL